MNRSILAVLVALSTMSCGNVRLPSNIADASYIPLVGGYVVVVHKDNPYSEDDAKMEGFIKSAYLAQSTSWPSGAKIEAYARKGGSDEMKAFQEKILGMSDSEVSRHWIKMKNSKGIAPPRALGSARLAVKYVAKNKGAFVVLAESDAPKDDSSGVKVLFKF